LVVERRLRHCWGSGQNGGWEWGKKNYAKNHFFLGFGFWFLSFWGMESTSIYRGWKRDMLSFVAPNLGPWFETKGSQLFVQSCHHGLKKLLQKGWLGWPFWGGTEAIVVLIGQNGPY
jgi:hypothetical protein